jgi:hypothetical protein
MGLWLRYEWSGTQSIAALTQTAATMGKADEQKPVARHLTQ